MWLQKFGDRDNETFNVNIIRNGKIIWELLLQYNYDNGDRMDPYDWCYGNSKSLRKNSISDRSNDELDDIILYLKSIKQIY